MKREGPQHGTVITFTILPHPLNPRPVARILNKLDSGPVTGIFAKVLAKPPNHSKFTGPKHPVGKSKNKCKGTQKNRSSDAELNYKRITWRVISDRDSGSCKLPVGARCSASRILDELATRDCFNDDHDDDEEEGDDHDEGDDIADYDYDYDEMMNN